MNYTEKLTSKFYGIMSWDDCYKLFDNLYENSNNWYFYDLDLAEPSNILVSSEFQEKITDIKNTIKELHQERYCGIVYTDDLKEPSMVKVFHPNNLGKSCGSSENPPLPRWIISKIQPTKIIQSQAKQQGFISKFFK